MTCAAPLLDAAPRAPEAAAPGVWARELLPVAATAVETFVGTVDVAGLVIRLAGISARLGDDTVTGSAGSLHDDPFPRAAAEMAERVAVLSAIQRGEARVPIFDGERRLLGMVSGARVFPQAPRAAIFRHARSNGVAAGATWADVARRARLELLERDHVLRSWFGEIEPVLVVDPTIVPPALDVAYDVRAYEFAGPSHGVAVAGVFGFPRSTGPLVYGFGARGTLSDALCAAASEMVQRLGFLWGEELPTAPPPPAPNPNFHQEHYLFRENHDAIRRWLAGDHARFRGLLDCDEAPREPVYADLTAAGGPLVVKALPRGHVPLVFGIGHPRLRAPLPPELFVHPIV